KHTQHNQPFPTLPNSSKRRFVQLFQSQSTILHKEQNKYKNTQDHRDKRGPVNMIEKNAPERRAKILATFGAALSLVSCADYSACGPNEDPETISKLRQVVGMAIEAQRSDGSVYDIEMAERLNDVRYLSCGGDGYQVILSPKPENEGEIVLGHERVLKISPGYKIVEDIH
ncbi:hypothetical protein LCL97_16895, partial [Seohaeicola saemankumensis]